MGRDHLGPPARRWLIVALLWSLAACSLAGAGRTPDASMAPRPGSTGQAAGAPPDPMSVSESTDRNRYLAGEQILVTVGNRLGISVYAPPRRGCSIVSLGRLDGQHWVNADSCPTLNVYVIEIAAMSDLTNPLGPASPPALPTGPVVIGPVGPSGSGGDLTNLPTVAPWQSGDPIREMPEGAIAPPFSATDDDLGPGTYRIEFGFAQGSSSGPVQTVYSEPFIVTD